jgi:hypothetical protein
VNAPELRARDRARAPQQLAHVPVQPARGADARGDDEEHGDGEEPFVRESAQPLRDAHDVRDHEHRERAHHDVVGRDDVPQEASERDEDDADGEPSLPDLAHRDDDDDRVKRKTRGSRAARLRRERRRRTRRARRRRTARLSARSALSLSLSLSLSAAM